MGRTVPGTKVGDKAKTDTHMLDPQLIKALRAQLEALKAQFYAMESELEQAREAAERRRKQGDRTAEWKQGQAEG